MGVVKDLKNINKHIDDDEARYQARKNNSDNGTGEKTKWVKLADKEAIKVIFLQELSSNSPRFSQKNDLGILAVEHNNPNNFRRKALCTNDDDGYVSGVCWACDQHRADYKAGWKQKNKLYINVLVDDGQNEPYVAVLSQGNGPKSVTPALIEQAGEFDSITDTWYKIKRSGSGLEDTSYILTRLGEHDKNVEDYDVYDLEGKVLRNIPFAEQEAFYLDGDSRPVSEEKELVGADTKVPW